MNRQKAKITISLGTDIEITFTKQYANLIELTELIVNAFDDIHEAMRYKYSAFVELPDGQIFPWSFMLENKRLDGRMTIDKCTELLAYDIFGKNIVNEGGLS